MSISLGSSTINNIYLGSTAVTAAYLGSTQVFGGGGGTYVTGGLVMYYDYGDTLSYPGSGSTVYDLISSTSGTIYNGTYSATSGGYMDFSAGGYVDTSRNMNVLVQNNTSWTYEFWFSRPGYGSATGFNNFVIGGVGTTTSTIFQYSDTGTDAQLAVFNGTSITFTNFASSYTKDRFNQFVIVADNPNGQTSLYINGSLISTIGNWRNLYANQTVALPGRSDISDRWQGKFSIARLYDRKLSSAEVTQNFDYNKARYGL